MRCVMEVHSVEGLRALLSQCILASLRVALVALHAILLIVGCFVTRLFSDFTQLLPRCMLSSPTRLSVRFRHRSLLYHGFCQAMWFARRLEW